MNLRDYQQQAVELAIREFERVQSTLVVMPTGTGKTVVIADIIKRFAHQSCIVLAHREELLNQARDTIQEHTGLECEFELGEQRASEMYPAPVLLASVQSMTSGRSVEQPDELTPRTITARRMHKFSPYNYGLVVVDEVHHGTAASYREVLNHFKANHDIKIIGVTATPERADKSALGQIMESVAFNYPILDAIKDGWLVPIQQQLVDIQSLDFSHVRTTAGDLNASDLGAVMEEESNLYGVCDATIKEIGDRQAITFCTTVRQAELCTDILNRYRPGFAVFASGKTPKEERRRIIRDFREGRYQDFVNCDLVGEGFDMPDASLLIDATLTKSRTRYQQRLGRIMRPLPGILEGGDVTCPSNTLPDQSEATPTFDPKAWRRKAISNSRKPVATVMDFVGNAGRHKLIHAIDILGGEISKEVRELAERELRKTGRPEKIEDIILEAERMENEKRLRVAAARKARLTARATYTMRTVNPFDVFDITVPSSNGHRSDRRLSEKQRILLRRQGVDPDQLTHAQAQAIINELFRRWNGKLCTLGQANVLKRFNYDTNNLTKERATELISALASNGWRRSDV